jgi:hypothetical protein
VPVRAQDKCAAEPVGWPRWGVDDVHFLQSWSLPRRREVCVCVCVLIKSIEIGATSRILGSPLCGESLDPSAAKIGDDANLAGLRSGTTSHTIDATTGCRLSLRRMGVTPYSLPTSSGLCR